MRINVEDRAFCIVQYLRIRFLFTEMMFEDFMHYLLLVRWIIECEKHSSS